MLHGNIPGTSFVAALAIRDTTARSPARPRGIDGGYATSNSNTGHDAGAFPGATLAFDQPHRRLPNYLGRKMTFRVLPWEAISFSPWKSDMKRSK